MLQIRCLKQHVLAQLLPVRQKIMRLVLRRSNIASAMAALGLVLAKSYFTSFLAALGVLNSDTSANDTEDEFSELRQGSVVSFILLVYIERSGVQ